MAVACPPLKEHVYVSHRSNIKPLLTSGRPLQYKDYAKEKLNYAYEAVSKGMSVHRAAEEYGIPKSTLHDRVVGNVLVGSKSGPRRHLNSTEEIELVNFFDHCASLGYSRSKQEVIQLAQSTVDMKGISAKVTAGWWKSFQSRHSKLTLRQPEPMSHCRMAAVSDFVLTNYFDLLESTLTQCNLTDHPGQIFNLDESGFPLSPKAPKVVAKRGTKHPISINGQEKSQITDLVCVSVSGNTIPPLVIFDRKNLTEELTRGEVPDTMYGLSDSGWMDSDIFQDWFANHFLRHAPASRPLLLLMDGHSSHFSPQFINRAAEEKVVVLCLPPNTTHKTQPLDKGVFGPLKQAWREECHSYIQSNPGKVITQYQFSLLFGRAWFKSGFRVTGVYPVNRDKLFSKDTTCISDKMKLSLPCPLLTPSRPYSSHTETHYNSHNDTSATSSAFNDTLLSSSSSTSDLSTINVPSSLSCSTPTSHTPIVSCRILSSSLEVSLTPASSRKVIFAVHDTSSPIAASDIHTPLSQEEIIKFAKKLEEGYDIKSDQLYNYWLSLLTKPKPPQGTKASQFNLLKKNSLFSKVFSQLPPLRKRSAPVTEKSCARVITSAEYRKQMNEKIGKKQEEQRLKEEKRLERERKKT